MPLPSSEFNIADWSATNILVDDGTKGLVASSSVSRGSPNVTSAGGVVRLQSYDGLPSSVRFPAAIGAIHTLEFTVSFIALPRRCEDADQARFFIGCLNAQGGTTGILLAQNGVAVAADPSADVLPLSGSQGLLPPLGTTLTVRILVNGRGGTAALYVTLTSQLSVTGHVLRRTVALPRVRGRLGDLLYIEALGTGADSTDVSLSSVRFGNGLVLPGKRPVASVEANAVTGVGVTTRLSGSGSSVQGIPSANLSYEWRIIRKPAGSSILLDGREDASVLASSVLFRSTRRGAAGNAQQIVITDPGLNPANDELVLDLVSSVIQVTLEHASTGVAGQTTAGGLVSGITDRTDLAYSPDVAGEITAEVSGDAETIVSAGTLELSGGADSRNEETTFVPDVAGLYEFGLIVSYDGLASEEVVTSITCMVSDVEIGRQPNLSFLWSYLPDFSRLTAGVEVLEVVWQAMLRLTAAELLLAMQIDYSKSIRDIPAQLQHKWVSFAIETKPTPVTLYLTAGEPRQVYPYDDGDGDLTTTSVRHTATGALAEGTPVTVYTGAGPVVALCKKDTPVRHSTTTASYSSTSDVITSTGIDIGSIKVGDPVLVLQSGSYVGFSLRAVLSDSQFRVDRALGATAVGSGTVQIGGLLTLDSDIVPVYELVDEGECCVARPVTLLVARQLARVARPSESGPGCSSVRVPRLTCRWTAWGRPARRVRAGAPAPSLPTATWTTAMRGCPQPLGQPRCAVAHTRGG